MGCIKLLMRGRKEIFIDLLKKFSNMIGSDSVYIQSQRRKTK